MAQLSGWLSFLAGLSFLTGSAFLAGSPFWLAQSSGWLSSGWQGSTDAAYRCFENLSFRNATLHNGWLFWLAQLSGWLSFLAGSGDWDLPTQGAGIYCPRVRGSTDPGCWDSRIPQHPQQPQQQQPTRTLENLTRTEPSRIPQQPQQPQQQQPTQGKNPRESHNNPNDHSNNNLQEPSRTPQQTLACELLLWALWTCRDWRRIIAVCVTP